ncbi:nucleoside recognition protein [Irregularibacter muris]|uniref:Nucleoside recognition protein n=1 Tax=Irregularibacter muris TaxID=1796619 RepID=A0AAE3HCP1_9FIRM|nr:nucleoside recognition domain-containing protein [Irregularibacter muris]MCR1897790.1 nucleoside recognition protein [Irregularibacter muris]
MIEIVQGGVKKGIITTWQLTKAVIPIYIVITFLNHTPIISIIAGYFEPLLQFLGLPGEAALVLVMGNLISPYAAVGSIPALNFSIKEITILTLMLSFSHSLLLESAVVKKMGGSLSKINILRVGMAVFSALILNILW